MAGLFGFNMLSVARFAEADEPTVSSACGEPRAVMV
jgi:hypothetical protein